MLPIPSLDGPFFVLSDISQQLLFGVPDNIDGLIDWEKALESSYHDFQDRLLLFKTIAEMFCTFVSK